MIKIEKNNLDYLNSLGIIDFTNNNNLTKIENIYNENYGPFFSLDEINKILNDDISIIANYDEYSFINKETGVQENIFPILVEYKRIYVNEGQDLLNGYVFTYHDNIELTKKIMNYDVYNKEGNIVSPNEKSKLVFNIRNFIQRNFFLQMFRSLYVNDKKEIVNLFNLRFFNRHEIINMANNGDYRWREILLKMQSIKPFFMEKVDGQLLMLFNYQNKSILQSKGSLITIDKILENDFDKNGIFSDLYNLIKEDGIKYLNNLAIKNKNIVYHFELLARPDQIVQEYKEPGIFLIGGRYINDLKNVINFSNISDFKKTYYSIFDSNILTDIIHSDDESEILNKIKAARSNIEDGNIDNYVVEGYIETRGYVFIKVKNSQYFVKKIIKGSSIQNFLNIIEWLKKILQTTPKILAECTSTIVNSSNNDININEILDGVPLLKQNRKMKMSYIKFIKYLKKYLSYDVIEKIIFSIENDKDLFIHYYKDFFVESFIDNVAGVLTSDQEEISELNEILGTGSELNTNSKTLKSDVKKIIYERLSFNENSYFIKSISQIITDIKNIK